MFLKTATKSYATISEQSSPTPQKPNKNKHKRVLLGFTLIELMIVVAIIGVLAAIAIPNFIRFSCRAKQAEAKVNLTGLFVAEESYHAEFDQYLQGATVAELLPAGFSVKGEHVRYSLSASSATASTFVGTAVGKLGGAMENDTWEINQDKKIEWISSAPECK
ncbi:MAG: prepilin-type N-terminal cleavage/methylation domain-containing protein [Deltaproteobacteria bacterium]|nr:prepilin-type N-terminal cleavage/methylation domain-containing protein [Deltaproteobacteria bacterium]